MNYHELKTWDEFWDDLVSGAKTFEIRKDDRNFKVGDVLIQKKLNPRTKTFSGDILNFYITYKTTFKQKKGYCVLGIRRISGSFGL